MPFKDIVDEEESKDIIDNNIKPEFNDLIELTNRTKQSFRYLAVSFVGKNKVFKKIINQEYQLKYEINRKSENNRKS